MEPLSKLCRDVCPHYRPSREQRKNASMHECNALTPKDIAITIGLTILLPTLLFLSTVVRSTLIFSVKTLEILSKFGVFLVEHQKLDDVTAVV